MAIERARDRERSSHGDEMSSVVMPVSTTGPGGSQVRTQVSKLDLQNRSVMGGISPIEMERMLTSPMIPELRSVITSQSRGAAVPVPSEAPVPHGPPPQMQPVSHSAPIPAERHDISKIELQSRGMGGITPMQREQLLTSPIGFELRGVLDTPQAAHASSPASSPAASPAPTSPPGAAQPGISTPHEEHPLNQSSLGAGSNPFEPQHSGQTFFPNLWQNASGGPMQQTFKKFIDLVKTVLGFPPAGPRGHSGGMM